MEKIVDDEDSAITKKHFNLLSEGFPSGLGRDIKPVLNSSMEDKNILKIPDDT